MELKRLGHELEVVRHEGDEPVKFAGEAPKPKDCQKYVRRRVAQQMPEITDRLLEEAMKGSVTHTKLLLALGGLEGKPGPKPRRHRGQTVAGRLLEWMGPEPEQ